jgi:hypothetical protein
MLLFYIFSFIGIDKILPRVTSMVAVVLDIIASFCGQNCTLSSLFGKKCRLCTFLTVLVNVNVASGLVVTQILDF